MIDKRTKGLIALYGCFVLLMQPILFFLLAVAGVEVFGTMEYNMVNFRLYLLGAFLAGVIYFNFYNVLSPSVSIRDRSRVFKVTNLQIFVLTLMLFGIIFATKDKAISRIFIGSYLMASYFILFFCNFFIPKKISQLVFRGGNARSCLLVGNTHSFAQVEEWLNGKESLGLNIVGMLNFGENDPAPIKIPVLGIVSQLEAVIRQHGVNQVILLETRQSKDWVQEILKVCEKEGAQIMIYNPWADYFDYPLFSVREGAHTFFMVREEPLDSPFNRLLKRFIDVAIALPVVCIVLPILVPIVWFFQRRESPGPVFFKQVRRGFNRKEFDIYKFRSMHYAFHNRSEGEQAKKGDERVYHFGLFMRRTSLDELPQFINVLLGNMSLVGPRPHLPEHDKIFSQEVQIYPQRHFVKPGITGLAQCKGYRGEITDVALLRKRVQYDLIYITDWSLWMDFEILLQTVVIVLSPPDTAY